MSDQLWPWVVTIIGVIGFFLAGKKIWWAWYVNIVNQLLWAIFAIVTEQWGFLLGIPLYLSVFVKNAYDWTREHRRKPAIKMTLPDPVVRMHLDDRFTPAAREAREAAERINLPTFVKSGPMHTEPMFDMCSGYGMARDALTFRDRHERCQITTPHTSHPVD